MLGLRTEAASAGTAAPVTHVPVNERVNEREEDCL